MQLRLYCEQFFFTEVITAKLYLSKLGVEIGKVAIQVYRVYSCLLEHDVKRSFSSAKILEIVEWKSEIHRLTTPREIVKGILIQ